MAWQTLQVITLYYRFLVVVCSYHSDIRHRVKISDQDIWYDCYRATAVTATRGSGSNTVEFIRLIDLINQYGYP